jgi:succinate dehydrogenase / fumarate reductase cytochrome b subunit
MAVMTLTRSTIGKKVIMAVTGLVWVGFLAFHMYGNLKVFQGAVYFNDYSEGLRHIGSPIFSAYHLLWVARIGLIVSVVLHIWAALDLTRAAHRARPENYALKKNIRADYAAVTIRYGGLVIFLFLVYHLAHFTWGVTAVHPDFIPGDAYHNLVVGFQNPVNVVLYLIALVAVGLHLYHGSWSMFQTLGFNNQKYDSSLRSLALALGVLIPLGFALAPFAVLFGIVTL